VTASSIKEWDGTTAYTHNFEATFDGSPLFSMGNGGGLSRCGSLGAWTPSNCSSWLWA